MKTKVKIAWLHTHFLLNTSGTRYVYEVATHLKSDFDITIFVEKTNKDWRDKFGKAGIDVIDVLPFSSNHPLYWLFFPLWVRRSARMISERTHGFDLLITSMFPMNWISTQLTKPTIQICFEPFAFFHDSYFVGSFPQVKQGFIKLMAKLYVNYDVRGSQKSERLMVPNSPVGEWVKKLYERHPSGITSIGVDSHLFQPTVDANLKAKYPAGPILFHITDYTAITGTDLLITLLPFVVRKHPRLKAIIAESISDLVARYKLIELARRLKVESHVDFIGQLAVADLPKYYSLADVYVYSGHPQSISATTAASLSALEAMACGTPVIGLGIDGIIVEGKSGYQIDPHDLKKSSQTLLSLLSRPSHSKRIGRWGREHVLANFTWEGVVKNIVEQINVLLDIHQQGFEQVKHQDQIIGMIFRHDTPIDKLKFFTDDMNPFQIGIHSQPAGVSLTPHVHRLDRPLNVNSIQELVYVQSGKIKVTFYSLQSKPVCEYTLHPGDAVLFMAQGHGVDFLEKSRLFMIKQGPYPGTQHAKLYLKPKT